MCVFGPSHTAPEHGPDFWRVLRDDPSRNQTNVTLLFQVHPLQATFTALKCQQGIKSATFATPDHNQKLQLSGQSYCVDGFIVQRRGATGSVVRQHIPVAPSYSFEWNRTPQTVTVEAYNSLGSSGNGVNMMLEKTPKRESAAEVVWHAVWHMACDAIPCVWPLAGRCVRSFSVMLINSTYVSLSWTLMDHTSVPLFMVVQWSQARNQDSDHHRAPSADGWVRLPYTDRPTYLKGSASCWVPLAVTASDRNTFFPVRVFIRFGGLRLPPVPRVC